jgi:hypothetical protein
MTLTVAPSSRAAVARLPWAPAVATVAVAVAVALHVQAAWDASGPIFYTDEIGYLSNAQLLAGVGTPRDLSFSSYYIGWSLPLVPLWWITSEPEQVYRGAVVLSVACALLLILPLTSLAERCGLRRPWAVVVAAVVASAPARVVPSNFALAENAITLLTASTVLAAVRFAEHPSRVRAAVLGAAAAAVFVTHGRMVSVLVVTLAWFLVLALRRRLAVGVTGAVVASAVAVPIFMVYRWASERLYEPSMDREARGVTRLLDVDPAAAVLAGTGQAWYVVVSSLGLAVVGAVVLLVLVRREWAGRRIGPATWGLGALAGLLAISVTWIAAVVARGDNRYDIYSYGRYLDPVVTVLALLGLAVVWRGVAQGAVRGAAMLSGAVVAAFLAVVVPRIPDDEATWWGPNSVAGLLQWDWPDVTPATRPPWYVASVAALAALVLLAVLTGTPRRLAVVLVCAALPLSSWAAQTKTVDPFFAGWYESFGLRHDVAALPEASVAFDVDGTTDLEGGGDTVSRNAYQFWLAPRTVEVVDTARDTPVTDLVIARRDWPLGEDLGAVRIAEDTGMFDNALWVMPGPLQDRLVTGDAR